jgi:hypothetical protein
MLVANDSHRGVPDEGAGPPTSRIIAGIDWITRFMRFALHCILWLIVWASTLMLLSNVVLKHVVGPDSQQGYSAYVSLIGPLVIMPIGLLLSCLVFALRKRLWLFLVLAIVVAAGTALVPLVLGMATIK